MDGQSNKNGVEYVLTMSGALSEKLKGLANQNEATPGEVLHKALALYEVALAARKQSCRVAVIDNFNRVTTAIEGL